MSAKSGGYIHHGVDNNTNEVLHSEPNFDELLKELQNDSDYRKDTALGKRVSLYRIQKLLGYGNFSQVKLGIHVLTKEKVAIKILDKTRLDQKTERLLSREISSMERLRHPNIVRLYEVVDTLVKLHIVMEYAGHGELYDHVLSENRLCETESQVIFAQIVAAVQHMHNMGICHRDLKAENVFFASKNWIKIGDFGFSTQCRNEALTTFCGSPPYAAPELFQDDNYDGRYVDVWACGILLYFMITGTMPFRAATVGRLKRKGSMECGMHPSGLYHHCIPIMVFHKSLARSILDGTYSIPIYVSDDCHQLIRGILKHHPADRLTTQDISDCKWLAGQLFPKEYPPFRINPSNGEASELETQVFQILKGYGIDKKQLADGSKAESHSSVTGTYRIVLHTLHKSAIDEGLLMNNSAEYNDSSNPKSKMCNIL